MAGSDDFNDSGRWRVFISHTAELRDFPRDRSYVAAVERAVSAAGHVVVNMADFPATDQPVAQICADRVRACEVYVGLLGTRYGSPVRDRPDVSYAELEFDTATEAGLDRLIFLLDTEADQLGIPPSALIDHASGLRQEGFRRRVQDGLVTQSFASPAELGQLVERSLRELRERRSRVGGATRGSGKSQLLAGESLLVEQSLTSPDGRTRFVLQRDGNAVVYVEGWADICDIGTANLGIPQCLKLEAGGFLTLYDVAGEKLWSKGPAGTGAHLDVQNNSHVVLYPANGEAIWATEYFLRAGMLVRWLPPDPAT